MVSSSSRVSAVGGVAAATLVTAGVVVWLTAPNTDASFGWFAYAPLADSPFIGPFILHGQALLAAGLVAVGLIIGGIALGFHWGRSVGRGDTRLAPDPFSHPSAQ